MLYISHHFSIDLTSFSKHIIGQKTYSDPYSIHRKTPVLTFRPSNLLKRDSNTGPFL